MIGCTYKKRARAEHDASEAERMWPKQYRDEYFYKFGRHVDFSMAFWGMDLQGPFRSGNSNYGFAGAFPHCRTAFYGERDSSFAGTNFSLKRFKGIVAAAKREMGSDYKWLFGAEATYEK